MGSLGYSHEAVGETTWDTRPNIALRKAIPLEGQQCLGENVMKPPSYKTPDGEKGILTTFQVNISTVARPSGRLLRTWTFLEYD